MSAEYFELVGRALQFSGAAYGLTLSVGPLYERWAWSRPYLPKG